MVKGEHVTGEVQPGAQPRANALGSGRVSIDPNTLASESAEKNVPLLAVFRGTGPSLLPAPPSPVRVEWRAELPRAVVPPLAAPLRAPA